MISLWGKNEAQAILKIPGGAKELVRLAEVGQPLAHQVAKALALRPDRYDRLFKEQFASQLEANPVAARLASAYELARDEEATTQCRLPHRDESWNPEGQSLASPQEVIGSQY